MKYWFLRISLICIILLFSISVFAYQDQTQMQVNLDIEPYITVKTEGAIEADQWRLGEFHSAGDLGTFSGKAGETRWVTSGAINITTNTDAVVKFEVKDPVSQKGITISNIDYLISRNFVEDYFGEEKVLTFNINAWENPQYYILAKYTVPNNSGIIKAGDYKGSVTITVTAE